MVFQLNNSSAVVSVVSNTGISQAHQQLQDVLTKMEQVGCLPPDPHSVILLFCVGSLPTLVDMVAHRG